MKLEVLNLHRGDGVEKEIKEKRKELRKVTGSCCFENREEKEEKEEEKDRHE